MPLDPQAQKLLDAARNAGLPPITKVSIEEARVRMAKALTYVGERETVASVGEHVLIGPAGKILARSYRPRNEGLAPGVVFFHGGGWVLNSLETHDHLCRALANLSLCTVISVDYRLAPEHKYPAAVEDAWAATKWICEHALEFGLDPNRISVAGDSSGATLAAVVAQIARDNGGPKLACQALAYPVMDHWSVGTRSYTNAGSGYSLSRDLMIWFWDNYLPVDVDFSDSRVCPLRSSDFRNLPETLVLTAEFDPLCDEGEQYASLLSEAKVPVTLTRYDGMMHGFVIQFRVLDKGRAGLEQMATFLRRILATP